MDRRTAAYLQYLQSDHWRSFRSAYFMRFPRECDLCGETAVELHHRTYKRLGREKVTDVVPLCRECHQGTHDFMGTKHQYFGGAHRRYRRKALQLAGVPRNRQDSMTPAEKKLVFREAVNQPGR